MNWNALSTFYNLTIFDQSPVLQYYPRPGIGPIDTIWNVTCRFIPEAGELVSGVRLLSALGMVSEIFSLKIGLHRTTSHPGASVSLDWIGTAIYLYGTADRRGSYTIDLDGIQTGVTLTATSP